MLKRVFNCMASPCEILLETEDPILMNTVEAAVVKEAKRIETKFSRYNDQGVLAVLQRSGGARVEVDSETAALIEFAKTCYELSDGLLDITSGVLRRVWSFKTPDDPVPKQREIARLLPLIGFEKLTWNAPFLTLPEGMQIDFGGIGKEYAVDRCLDLVSSITTVPCLLNFGGDLAAKRAPSAGEWRVGIEGTANVVEFKSGGIATSGDQRRYLKVGSKIYSHILNPKTGWAVESPYTSISVLSSTCTNAGVLATLSFLQDDPKAFLEAQGCRYWLQKDAP